MTKDRFGGYSGEEIYVAWKDQGGANSAAVQARLDRFFTEAEKVDHVAKHTPLRFSEDKTIGTTTLPLTVPGSDVKKAQGEELIKAAEDNDGNGLEIKLGGAPIYAAQSQSSPEGLGFLGAAIVLLVAFGSLVAAGLPLVIALVGLGITSGGLIVLLANIIDVPDWTTAVSGLIGIGVGIDYALLVLTRFRSAVHDGKTRHDAIVESVTTAGRSVIIAGFTVVIAVLGLCLTGLPYMYGVAISASLAVLVVMLASITLLPSLLAYLGHRVDNLRIPLLSRGLSKGDDEDGHPFAARWAHGVQAPALGGRDRRGADPARAGSPGARDAAWLPRCRQRPARHDDPPGIRPQHRGLRGRQQRAAGDRRRPARPQRLGRDRLVRGRAPQGARRRVRAGTRPSTRRATRP